MKSIQELAMEYADRHEEAELNLRGLGGIYGYNRIKNAEICAYERGAKERNKLLIEKFDEWLCNHSMITFDEGNRKALAELREIIVSGL